MMALPELLSSFLYLISLKSRPTLPTHCVFAFWHGALDLRGRDKHRHAQFTLLARLKPPGLRLSCRQAREFLGQYTQGAGPAAPATSDTCARTV